MSEAASAPASFLNLDLELESDRELPVLEKELGRGSHILYSGPVPGGYRLALEPLVDGKLNADADACTEHFLSMLEALPDSGRAEFSACRSRVFDYGFDGGLEANPIRTDLSSGHVGRIAALGLTVRITTYPYRAAEPEDAE